MKSTFIILLLISQLCSIAQEATPAKIVRTGKVFTNHKLSYYYENDKKGNTLFTKNNGMNGPITMLYVAEYDSLNRKTRTYFAHSNIGFSLNETVYETNKIAHYEYVANADESSSYDRDTLNKVNSQDEFLQLSAIKELLKGKKRLTEIEVLDAHKNVTDEIYFSEEGDTSSINAYHYNSNNKKVLFNYGLRNKEPWIWDICYLYDKDTNLVKSIRLSSKNGVKDTTEIYSYSYNPSRLLTSKSYYNKHTFKNKTEYVYNNKNKVVEERFYEGDESELDVLTRYAYQKNGMLLKKTQKDFRNPKKDRKEVYTYSLIYW